MTTVKFEDYKVRIRAELDLRLRDLDNALINERGFTLIDGFFNQPFQKEISGSFVIGGPALPMVGVVGNTTGRIYFFALKVLIPEINLQ